VQQQALRLDHDSGEAGEEALRRCHRRRPVRAGLGRIAGQGCHLPGLVLRARRAHEGVEAVLGEAVSGDFLLQALHDRQRFLRPARAREGQRLLQADLHEHLAHVGAPLLAREEPACQQRLAFVRASHLGQGQRQAL
jgi:hypothetical protein